MKFRTEIQIPKSLAQLDYSSKILSLGSCFAISIGEKLQSAKFKACVNPTGLLFNPLSICAALKRLDECREISEEELHKGPGGWFHFDFHSSLSATTISDTLYNINSAIQKGSASLRDSDTIIITLGTAWVYRLVDSGAVVANCHKEPTAKFERSAMSVEQVVEALSAEVEKYPNKKFIFSVSPVRHFLDGLSENSLSKAILRVAVSQVVARYDNASYFPAYEIVIDDLRDYRFYADDMLHPSSQAVEYIWSKFIDTHIAESAYSTMEMVSQIVRAAAHRPFNIESEAHQKFCIRQLELIKEYPNIDFGKENAIFMSQLQNNL